MADISRAFGKAIEEGELVVPTPFQLKSDKEHSRKIGEVWSLFKERINEYPAPGDYVNVEKWYAQLVGLGKPADEWIKEAIVIAGSKTKESKRSLGYVVGIIKGWLRYGYKSDLHHEQISVMDIFGELYPSRTVTDDVRNKLLHLLDTHGIARTVAELFKHQSISDDPGILLLSAVVAKQSELFPNGT